MSLAEIPQTHIRRNGPLPTLRDASSQSDLHAAGVPAADKGSTAVQKSNPVHNMLRNTTEIGDVGQFAVKPPRVTTSAAQLSPAISNRKRSTSSKRRYPGSYHIGYRGYDRYHSPQSHGHGSTGSKGSALRASGRQGTRRMPSFEDYRSFSLMQSSYGNHSLVNRHPHTGSYYHSRAGIQSSRPYSPIAYPTRLRRPGFRAPSPGPSDLHSSWASFNQASSREPSVRTVSPSSGYNLNRTPSPFRYVINRSDPHLQHYPPYLASENLAFRVLPNSFPQSSTPTPSPNLSNSKASSQVQSKKLPANSAWLHSQTPPASPIFYDYTEHFAEHDRITDAYPLVEMYPCHPTQNVDTGSYSELEESRKSMNVAELPTKDSSTKARVHDLLRSTSQREHRVDGCGETHAHLPLQDLSDVPELPETEATINSIAADPQDHHHFSNAASSLNETANLQEAVRHCSTSSKQHIRRPEQSMGDGVAVLEVSSIPVATSSLSSRSMLSVRSLTLPESYGLKTEPTQDSSNRTTSDLSFEASEQAEAPHVTCPESRVGPVPELLQGRSLGRRSRVPANIHSPTPERSITSSSTRDRFSRILSIDEGSSNSGLPISRSGRKAGLAGSMQMSFNASPEKSARMVPADNEASGFACTHRPEQSSDSDTSANRKPASDGELELTVDLRNIFGRKSLNSAPCQVPLKPTYSSQSGCDTSITSQHNSASVPMSAILVNVHGDQARSIPEHTRPNAESTSREAVSLALQRSKVTCDESTRSPSKESSMQSFSPPFPLQSSKLPFDFTPLIRRSSNKRSCSDPGNRPTAHVKQGDLAHEEVQADLPSQPAQSLPERSSTVHSQKSSSSRPGSRPWNHDSSYPWNDQVPELEVTMPHPKTNMMTPSDRIPRFKLKIHRASSSAEGLGRLTRELLSCDTSRQWPSSTQDMSQRSSSCKKRVPDLAVLPGQLNSSHDIIRSSRQHTRFVETFESQSPTSSTFLPISPNYDVRSFFSDDSSQMRQKGTLRKRFSDFKARAVAARAASMDESQGHDRGLLTSALGRSRASGRSSRQSHTTAGAGSRNSNVRRAPRNLMKRIRMWLHLSDDKVRDWTSKLRFRNGKADFAGTTLYAGV